MTQPSRSEREPRWCRWFGHAWASTISGEPIDWFIGNTFGFVACRRCGVLHDEPLMSSQVAELLRELDEMADA